MSENKDKVFRYDNVRRVICEAMKWQAESGHSWEKIGSPVQADEAVAKIFALFGEEPPTYEERSAAYAEHTRHVMEETTDPGILRAQRMLLRAFEDHPDIPKQDAFDEYARRVMEETTDPEQQKMLILSYRKAPKDRFELAALEERFERDTHAIERANKRMLKYKASLESDTTENEEGE